MSVLTELSACYLKAAQLRETRCECGHPLRLHSLYRGVCEPLTGPRCRCQEFAAVGAGVHHPREDEK